MPKQIGQKQLVQDFKDVKSMSSQKPRFCFLIGAGASISSGIPSGWKLAKEWYEELQEILDEDVLNKWKDKVEFDEVKVGEFYPQLYEKRFESNPKIGYEKFKKIMEGKEPDLGYVILSQILASEPHNFVITTNFDYLIEDAVRQFTDTKPFVAGHEMLAGFVASQRDRPTIVKVHRDLFLNPINDIEGTNRLKQEWKETLKPILRDFNLLVIGYGGNDGSLMDYLTEIGEDNREAIYWCKREGDALNEKVSRLLAKKDYEVSIKGFDELMYLLYGALEYNTFKGLGDQDHQFIENAKGRNERLNKRLGELAEGVKNKKAIHSEEKNPAENLLSDEWSYVLAEDKETDPEKKEHLFLEGIKHFPNGAYLIGNYAIFLTDFRKDNNKAEEYYRKALDLDPDNANFNGNYAVFLKNIRKDYDQAEKFYLKALELATGDANINGNYAIFLKIIRKDYNLAEEYYRKALELDPNNAIINGNYAFFLAEIRKEYDKAEKYYLKTLQLTPGKANLIGNYANFLTNIRKDFNQAEVYYQKALKTDPDSSNKNGNYAHHLLLWKQDFTTAESHIDKAFEYASDIELLAELWFYRFVHYPEHRNQAEKELKKLIKKGAKSIDWNFQGHIDIAEKSGHPKMDKLKEFAKALGEE